MPRGINRALTDSKEIMANKRTKKIETVGQAPNVKDQTDAKAAQAFAASAKSEAELLGMAVKETKQSNGASDPIADTNFIVLSVHQDRPLKTDKPMLAILIDPKAFAKHVSGNIASYETGNVTWDKVAVSKSSFGNGDKLVLNGAVIADWFVKIQLVKKHS